MKKIERVIISGGGTGGHIFPAIAIANEIKKRNPEANILFVGAEGKMEMEKVPQAGYSIVGLPIRGLQRKFTLTNFLLPFKIIKSLLKARKTIKEHKPELVIGVGGYASGPTLMAASWQKIPTIIQEQNSFAGKTNIILGKKANKICVAYAGLEQFFPKDKIVLTGNPVRNEMVDINDKRDSAIEHFKFQSDKKTVLIIGGSLGARTLNNSVFNGLISLQEKNIQVIWQCGKLYKKTLEEKLQNHNLDNIILTDFIARMDFAYAAADVVVSRAGAISVSELCLVGKPTILVPSPNVAEDHQTHNAMALVNKDAAILVKDNVAEKELVSTLISLVENKEEQKKLASNITQLAKPRATEDIVNTLTDVLL
ncbi:MAG: undecaprenyldiphospho-muramoylpentapeptide beta-N-acetylglucosaminyltransferase [Lishizhenia sp.]